VSKDDSEMADDAGNSTMLNVVADNAQGTLFQICSLLARRSIIMDGVVCKRMLKTLSSSAR
jgi:acetolactate synthase small subunit